MGKVCVWLKWLISQIPGPQLLYNPQKIPTRALHHCFSVVWGFLLNNPITTSCFFLALEPWKDARNDVHLLALNRKASWRVKGRAHWGGPCWLQQQYSRNHNAFGMLGRRLVFQFCERHNLTGMYWRLASATPYRMYLCSGLAESCLLNLCSNEHEISKFSYCLHVSARPTR